MVTDKKGTALALGDIVLIEAKVMSLFESNDEAAITVGVLTNGRPGDMPIGATIRLDGEKVLKPPTL